MQTIGLLVKIVRTLIPKQGHVYCHPPAGMNVAHKIVRGI